MANAAGVLFYSDEWRVMYKFICDMCGKELEQHGQRYLVTVKEVVPMQFIEPEPMKFDLCRECVVKLNEQLDRGEK